MFPGLRKEGMTFALKVLLPTILVISIFVITIFAIVLPFFENNMLERKREMIQELTMAAVSILEKFESDEAQGLLTRDQAQQSAIESIEYLRYGEENKDYFWITDTSPRMIMHPYRTDLDNKDLSDYKDSKGKKLFVEAVSVVKEKGEGYIDYFWQWKDDASRIVQKVSYVKEFKPWGWIIGTGIYIEDVKSEIQRLESRLVWFSVMATLLLAGILFYLTRHSLKVEQKKQAAETELTASRERYKALVEASTEGTLMLFEDGSIYGNRHILNLLGYNEDELRDIPLSDLISYKHTNFKLDQAYLTDLMHGNTDPEQFTSKLISRNGSLIDIILSASRISVAGQNAVILSATEIRPEASRQSALQFIDYRSLGDQLQIGFFRILFQRDSRFIEGNLTASRLLGFSNMDTLFNTPLDNIFFDYEERKAFLQHIRTQGNIANWPLQARHPDGTIRTVEVSAIFTEDQKSKTRYIDGTLTDITAKRKTEAEREDLIVELQTSLLFVSQPLKNILRKPMLTPMDTSIQRATEIMSQHGSSVLIITTDTGRAAGILTDHDLRERAIAGGTDLSLPVYEIMTSPVIALHEEASVSDAIRMMEECNINHIAVKNNSGDIIGLAGSDELLYLLSYSSHHLMERIQQASDQEELATLYKRLPLMVKSMVDSGANARNITRIITRFSDAITQRVIEMAIVKVGEPPCPFSFILMGSEGRGEQTLATDQDNAIIFEDQDDEKTASSKKYFLQLGTTICTALDAIGYTFCEGEIMAMNPAWCMPLSHWKQIFTTWIQTLSPKDLLNVNIFFDFRHGFGEENLTQSLRDHLNKIMPHSPAFFHHLAQNALETKPPLNFFGNIVVENSGVHSDTFNVKSALLPLTAFARVYALQQQVADTHTLERLDKLLDAGILSRGTHVDFSQVYNYLMILRFRHQLLAIDQQRKPGNHINPKSLSELEQSLLKKVFSQISTFQSKISFDFSLNK